MSFPGAPSKKSPKYRLVFDEIDRVYCIQKKSIFGHYSIIDDKKYSNKAKAVSALKSVRIKNNKDFARYTIIDA